MLAIGVVIMVTAGLPGPEVAVALGLVGVLGGDVRGRWPARDPHARALPRHAYRIVLVVVVAALVYLQPEASFLLFIAFPQAWVFSDRIREGVGYTLLLVIGVATAESIRSGWAGGVFLDNLPWWSVSVLVSLVFGMWVSKIIDESGQRAELIDTLERTQARAGRGEPCVRCRRGAGATRAGDPRHARPRIHRHHHARRARLRPRSRGATSTRPSRRLASIEAIARDNLGEARALVAAFSPLGLDDTTLIEALRRLAGRFEAETGVRVTVRPPTDDRRGTLPAAHQVVLLRAAQEALANVRKHAAATRVEIALSTGADGTPAIEVTDNGNGFDPGLVEQQRVRPGWHARPGRGGRRPVAGRQRSRLRAR